MKQFEVLLGKIRTAEVRDAIASVRAWCGRGMLVLSILIGVAILGVAAVAVVLDSLSKTTDYQLTVLDEMRIQNVIQDAELESLAELRILWDEHAARFSPLTGISFCPSWEASTHQEVTTSARIICEDY